MLVASALTGENVDRLFTAIRKIRRAAHERISTGVLNRLLRDAFAANPPPMSANKRMKLFYATQTRGEESRALTTPEFVLFVNDPQLLGDTYARYLEGQIRDAEPFRGLPLMLNFRPRTEKPSAETTVRDRARAGAGTGVRVRGRKEGARRRLKPEDV